MAHSGKYRARIHRPRHQRQKRTLGGKLIGCTETVFAMFADAVTLGGVRLSEGRVRLMSNEPVPDPGSPGLNLGQMDAVAAKLGIGYANRTGKGDSWADIVARLNENRRVQVSVWIGVNHSELLQAVRARPGAPGGFEVLKNDPLKGKAEWVVDDTIRAQAQAFVTHNGGNGLWYAYSSKLPFVAAGAS
jgi:hypothetical protein